MYIHVLLKRKLALNCAAGGFPGSVRFQGIAYYQFFAWNSNKSSCMLGPWKTIYAHNAIPFNYVSTKPIENVTLLTIMNGNSFPLNMAWHSLDTQTSITPCTMFIEYKTIHDVRHTSTADVSMICN